ncbi:MAG: hypothetical protein RLZZ299_1820 [Pseudomonadota bacterium]
MVLGLLFACAAAQLPHGWRAADTLVVPPRAEVRADVPAGMVRVVVAAGSAWDPPGREGLAFAAAHVVAHGLAGPDAGKARVEVSEDVVRLTFDAASLPDWMTAVGAVPDAAALATARDAAQAWWDGASCEALAEAAWAHVAYRGHPYGHAPAGRRGVHATWTAAEVRGFLARNWVRGAVRVAAASAEVDTTLLSALPGRLPRPAVPAVRDHGPRPGMVLRVPPGRPGFPAGGCGVEGAAIPLVPAPPAPGALPPHLRALASALDGQALAAGRAEARTLGVPPGPPRPAGRAGAPISVAVVVDGEETAPPGVPSTTLAEFLR